MGYTKSGLIMVLTSTWVLNAVELPRTGWNLIAICQDMNSSEIDMSNIDEIQAQDGHTLYSSPTDEQYSNLDQLEAGYGYWVKGAKGVIFSEGVSASPIVKPLVRDGWNLMAACEDRLVKDVNMSEITEIQSQDGTSLYTGEFASYSNLLALNNGYGYWVKGNAGTPFSAKRSESDPYNDLLIAKNHLLRNVTATISGLDIMVVTDRNVTEISNQTMAIYGQVNGTATNALLKLNSNYSEGTHFAVKVYHEGCLVGLSEELVLNDAAAGAINFGSITTHLCD